MFTDLDSYFFHQGTHYESYKVLGAHPTTEEELKQGKEYGTTFSVHAPNAHRVAVITAKTGWDNQIEMWYENGGVWSCFVKDVCEGDAYRYLIDGADGVRRYKADPYAFRTELRPGNSSIVQKLDNYTWNDDEYMAGRSNDEVLNKPMAIYEVHLSSWKRASSDENGFLDYYTLADQLSEYVQFLGFTHVEVMGICEYPFDGSWGYQVTGYYSPTARYGTPDGFRYFVDKMHQCGIGVILDWVPAHFPKDTFAFEYFDGTPLFESGDPLRAEYPEWGTKAFDHSKPEVRSFLISNAFYWINEFHVDALRVDAVAAMIYANYSRSEWRPNMYGGYLNLESMDFLRQLNHEVHNRTSGYLIAEDSSTEQGITEPTRNGGLGFTLKWDLGWMHDTLDYLQKDPIYRRYHHGGLTHTLDYVFSENFVLVLSHDEVVYGKKSMFNKMPGSIEEKFGCLKALYTFQFTSPGKKLLFMGQEWGMLEEWNENREIEWWGADDFGHRDVMETLRRLLKVYKSTPALYTDGKNPAIFEWINRNDADRNIISYIRRNPWSYDDAVVVVCNFSAMEHHDYACGVPLEGDYKRIFSTYDALPGQGGPGDIEEGPVIVATNEECDGRDWRITYSLRPYECIVLEVPTNKAEEADDAADADETDAEA